MSSVRALKAKEDKNLDSQAKTNSLFVVRALTFKLNVRNVRNRCTLLCALRATEA
jgi:hypothetical protein